MQIYFNKIEKKNPDHASQQNPDTNQHKNMNKTI